MKPSLLFSTLDAVFPKDLFSDYLEITTTVVVPCGGPEHSPRTSTWCCWFYIFGPLGLLFFNIFWGEGNRAAVNPELGGIRHYLSWTDSIKPSMLFSNFRCCISKGSLFQIIEWVFPLPKVLSQYRYCIILYGRFGNERPNRNENQWSEIWCWILRNWNREFSNKKLYLIGLTFEEFALLDLSASTWDLGRFKLIEPCSGVWTYCVQKSLRA